MIQFPRMITVYSDICKALPIYSWLVLSQGSNRFMARVLKYVKSDSMLVWNVLVLFDSSCLKAHYVSLLLIFLLEKGFAHWRKHFKDWLMGSRDTCKYISSNVNRFFSYFSKYFVFECLLVFLQKCLNKWKGFVTSFFHLVSQILKNRKPVKC